LITDVYDEYDNRGHGTTDVFKLGESKFAISYTSHNEIEGLYILDDDGESVIQIDEDIIDENILVNDFYDVIENKKWMVK